jgi:hypothetical protein
MESEIIKNTIAIILKNIAKEEIDKIKLQLIQI